MQDDEDKMLYRKVAVKGVNNKVDTKFLEHLKRKVDLNRVQSEVQTINKSKYSEEERIKRALKAIEISDFIYLQDYAIINEISRSMASRELKIICEKEDAPIKSLGQGSHKIWVKK